LDHPPVVSTNLCAIRGLARPAGRPGNPALRDSSLRWRERVPWAV